MVTAEVTCDGAVYRIRLDDFQLRRRGVGDLITCEIIDVQESTDGD